MTDPAQSAATDRDAAEYWMGVSIAADAEIGRLQAENDELAGRLRALKEEQVAFVSALEKAQAENEMLREAVADALADCRPGYAPFSVLDDALRSLQPPRASDETDQPKET